MLQKLLVVEGPIGEGYLSKEGVQGRRDGGKHWDESPIDNTKSQKGPYLSLITGYRSRL
jgi:hypothetical protein